MVTLFILHTIELMRKLVFTLLLFLASSAASADDLCMSVMSDPDKRPLDRDPLLIVAPFPVYPRSALTEPESIYQKSPALQFDSPPGTWGA